MLALKNWILHQILDWTSYFTQIKVYLGYLNIGHGQYGYYEYKDIPFSSVIHPPDRLKALETYDDFRSDDLIVYTYPKAGTHFVADIVWAIRYEAGIVTEKIEGMAAAYPLELLRPTDKPGRADDPLSTLGELKSPRLFMSHLPWSMLPPKVKSHQVKLIHCIRNPKDIIGSAFTFLKKTSTIARYTTWEQFFNAYISGKMIYGDYFDFLREWYPHRNNQNQLTIYFEDMLTDLKTAVIEIAKFIEVELTDEQIDNVVQRNTFSNLKMRVGNDLLHRKGQIGSWQMELTVEQNKLADEWISKNKCGLDELKIMFT